MTEAKDTRHHRVDRKEDLEKLVGKKVGMVGTIGARYEGEYDGKHTFVGRFPDGSKAIVLFKLKEKDIIYNEDGNLSCTPDKNMKTDFYDKGSYMYSVLNSKLEELGI